MGYEEVTNNANTIYLRMKDMKINQTIALVSSSDTRVFKLVEIKNNKKKQIRKGLKEK